MSLHVTGPEALEIYNTFSWDNEGDESKVVKIMEKEKFWAYCNPQKTSHGKDMFLIPATRKLVK